MLDGKRIAILVEDGFEDSELMEPYRAMKEANARVVIIGSGTQETYRGKRGRASISVDAIADDVNIDSFDAVIIPGGHAPDKMRMHESMIKLVRQAYDAGKLVAAVCHGPQLLISADIARGHTMTSWPSIAVDLKNAGAKWVNEPVVQDGNLITARKPSDLPRFNKAIVDALRKKNSTVKKI